MKLRNIKRIYRIRITKIILSIPQYILSFFSVSNNNDRNVYELTSSCISTIILKHEFASIHWTKTEKFQHWYFDSIAFSFPLKIQCTPLSLHTYIYTHTKEGKGWRNHYTAHNIHFCLILFMNFCHQNIQSFYLLQPTNLSTPLGNQTDVFSRSWYFTMWLCLEVFLTLHLALFRNRI